MLTHSEMILRLVLAGAMGAVIGFERERLLWAAGLRTHMLVSVGACLFMLVSAFGFQDVVGREGVTLDPSRVAAQVVSGIGFLGAGTILLRGEVVKGLTTAASLWAVAAIGLAIGGGLYVASVASTALIVGILAGVKPIETFWHDRNGSCTLRVTCERGTLTIENLSDATGIRGSCIRQFVVSPADRPEADEVTISFVRVTRASVDAVAKTLRERPGVVRVEAGDAAS